MGKRETILHKLKQDRSGLKKEIEAIVYSLTMKKVYPQIEVKKKSVLALLAERK